MSHKSTRASARAKTCDSWRRWKCFSTSETLALVGWGSFAQRSQVVKSSVRFTFSVACTGILVCRSGLCCEGKSAPTLLAAMSFFFAGAPILIAGASSILAGAPTLIAAASFIFAGVPTPLLLVGEEHQQGRKALLNDQSDNTQSCFSNKSSIAFVSLD